MTPKNDKYLYRSLSDAEKVIDYIPNFSKGYIQAAELAFKLNELERSEKFYQNALAIECNNHELKNSLAMVRAKIGQQYRMEHLELKYLALSTEEYDEISLKQWEEYQGIKLKNQYIDEAKSQYIKENPIKADVLLRHEYQYGSNKVEKNYELAAQYYGKAANKNDAEALYNLALLHIRGLGVKMDYQTVISLFKLATEQPDTLNLNNHKVKNEGVAEAEHSLGLAYYEGTCVEKNFCSTVYWLDRAVQHGNGDSAHNLGSLHRSGEGVTQN